MMATFNTFVHVNGNKEDVPGTKTHFNCLDMNTIMHSSSSGYKAGD